MDLSEAIRIAEKIRPWIGRMPELRAGLDALIDLAREQQQVKRKSPLTELWEEMFGPLASPTEDETEPEKIAINDIINDRTGSGTISTLTPHGVRVMIVDKWDDPTAKPEAKPAPKVGDLVPWAHLDSLQVGTVVAWVTGERGIVRSSGGIHDVAWSDAKLRGGGTVRVVLLPEEAKNGAE